MAPQPPPTSEPLQDKDMVSAPSETKIKASVAVPAEEPIAETLNAPTIPEKPTTDEEKPLLAVQVTEEGEKERAQPIEEEESEVDRSPDGRFIRFKKEVGRGSFKTVYKGQDTNSGAAVAWLELQPHKITKEDRERFRAEAEILKKLKHTNIVQFYDTFEMANKTTGLRSVVLVTELMTSGTLKTYLKRFKVIRSRPLKSWSRQILQGLKYLHSRNPVVLHRDLKCDNIFVTGTSGVVKIGDLGLATFKRQEVAKSVIGTPEFMAPEMYDENYSEPADVYAFGMCLLEMVTNEYPYEECANPTQIYRLVVKGTLPKVFEKVEDERIKHIIKQCIEFEPSNRATVAALLDNEFFDDKELNVLVVGRNGGELKLRLVVYEGNMKKAMPEDEAIDFNFTIGQDTAYQVAQSMSVESTLKTEFVPQVAKAIMDAVEKTKKKDLEEKEKKEREIQETTTLPKTVDQTQEDPINKAANAVALEAATQDDNEHKTTDKKSEIVKPVKVDGKSEKARRAKNKRLAVTVMDVKPLFSEGQEENNGDNTGWEVTVRVTSGDVTTIVFKVERQRQEDEAATQLANEIINNKVVPDNKRENIEKLLLEIINRLLSGKLTNEASLKEVPAIKWNGCNRSDDEKRNMEIEVEVDSIRHVPAAKIKYNANLIHQQMDNLKTQGIIVEHECEHVFEEFSRILRDSLEKMGTKDEIAEWKSKESDGLSYTASRAKEVENNHIAGDQRPKSLHIDITPRKREVAERTSELPSIDEKIEKKENQIANISKEISKPLQENEPLAKKIDEGESGQSKPEPVIQTKGRFEIKSNVEKIDVKEKEIEMPGSVAVAPVPAVSAKSANMNDGVTQTDNEDECAKTVHKEEPYRGVNLSDIKEKLSNINNNSKKDTKEKMASSIATSQSQAPQVHSNTSSNADDETDGQHFREDITSKIAFGASRSIKDFVSEMTNAYADFNEKQSDALEGQMELFRKNMAEQAERNNLELKSRLDEIFKNFDKRLLSALDQSKKKKRPRKSIDARRQSDSSEEAFRAEQARKADSHPNQIQSTIPERAPSIPQPENFTRASPSMSQIPQQADLSTVPGVAQYQAAPNPNFPYFSQLQPNNQQAMSTMPYVIPTQMYQQGHLPKITSAADHFGHEGTRIAKELARNFQVISPHMMNAMPAQMMGNTMGLPTQMQTMPQLSQHQLQQINQYQMQMASLQNSAMVQQAQQAPPVQQQQPPNPQQQQQQQQPAQQPPQQKAPPPQLQNPLLQQQHQQNAPQQSRSIPDLSTSGSVQNHPIETPADRTKNWVNQINPTEPIQQEQMQPQPTQQQLQQQTSVQQQQTAKQQQAPPPQQPNQTLQHTQQQAQQQQQAPPQHQQLSAAQLSQLHAQTHALPNSHQQPITHAHLMRRAMDPSQVVSPPTSSMGQHSQMQPMHIPNGYQLPTHNFQQPMMVQPQGQPGMVPAQNMPTYQHQKSMPDGVPEHH